MKNCIILICVLGSLSVMAQKRNIIKPLCFDWEYMDYSKDESGDLNFSNVFNYKFGYERLIGKRLSVGLSYMSFFSPSEGKDIRGDNYSSYSPENIPGYYYDRATYTNKIRGFEYESRYFFSNLEEDGLNSGYLGFMYGYLSSKQSLTNATYNNSIDPTDRFTKQYPDKEVNIHRFGLKLGYAASGAIYTDIHIGIFYNSRPNDYNKGWTSPSDIYPVNVVLGWHIGIPFKP